LLGIMFMSSLFKDRAPENGALLTVFMGGIRNDQLCNLSDERVKDILAKEFSNLTGLKQFNPDLLELNRYSHAIPQYTANTGKRLTAISNLEQNYPGLHIAGNLRDGIGMADRIKQASQLACEL
jgi:protoporphyrinogen/coproporphyrinogen III oxidase